MKTGCFAEPTPANCGFFARTIIRDEFSNQDRECFFYEDNGKDSGFPRWRVCFYYASHLALTKFFASEAEKDRFIASLIPSTQ